MSRLIAEDLVDAVVRGETVVFCGAGLSVSAGLPSGSSLGNLLAGRLDAFDGNPGDLAEVASAYEADRGRHALTSFVIDQIAGLNVDPTPAHEGLCRLPFAGIITTNWDDLLERTLAGMGRDYTVLVTDREVPFLRGGSLPVVKMHGSLERPDSLVVTDRDFYDLFRTQSGILSLLEGYFATRTVLFLGFGLNDPDFKRLYHECTARFGRLRRRSYAVQLNPGLSAVGTWQREQLEVIDRSANTFMEELAAIVAGRI